MVSAPRSQLRPTSTRMLVERVHFTRTAGSIAGSPVANSDRWWATILLRLVEQVFATPGPVDSVAVVDSAAQPERVGPLVAFHYREFSVFFGAGLLSNTGTWMQTVTVPYVVDQLTHSTALVGLSAFAGFFPATIVGPLAGSLADRYDRRTVLIWAQVIMMSMATALWASWATGVANVPIILWCGLTPGSAPGSPPRAWQSFVPQLVPRPVLLSAVRVNSMQFTAARVFGPALAGLVLATLGPSAAFGFNVISFLAVIGALHDRPPPARRERKRRQGSRTLP